MEPTNIPYIDILTTKNKLDIVAAKIIIKAEQRQNNPEKPAALTDSEKEFLTVFRDSRKHLSQLEDLAAAYAKDNTELRLMLAKQARQNAILQTKLTKIERINAEIKKGL